MLSKSNFIVLRSIIENTGWENIGLSKEDIDLHLNVLKEKDLLSDDNQITEHGLDMMKPYKVDNAIIMAAGMSSRFAPMSYERPKGLLKVKNEILIERQVEQLLESGIDDITIVLGYMSERFMYLKDKYNLKIVVNEDYYKYNNTSTLIRVLDELKNTYLCSSDNYYSENVFHQYEYQAFYPVIEDMDDEAGEYYASIDDKGNIIDITIGTGSLCMMGYVYFSKSFSDKFKTILVKEYEKEEVRTNLWELLYLNNVKELVMEAKLTPNGIIHEFDSLEELRQFDDYYLNHSESKILDNIMEVFGCELEELNGFSPVTNGLTNLSFRFSYDGKNYIYRHPGVGTEEYINRAFEYESQLIAKEQGIDDSLIIMDQYEGWKISRYIENVRHLDYDNDGEVQQAMDLVRHLHDLKIKVKADFDIWGQTQDFIRKNSERNVLPEDYGVLLNRIEQLYQCLENDNYEKVLCHCDFYQPNILFDDTKCYLIDWEYAAMADPALDIGVLISCANKDEDRNLEYIKMYLGNDIDESTLAHYYGYVALAAYYWYTWALFQESNGNLIGEFIDIWFNYADVYSTKALDMYMN